MKRFSRFSVYAIVYIYGCEKSRKFPGLSAIVLKLYNSVLLCSRHNSQLSGMFIMARILFIILLLAFTCYKHIRVQTMKMDNLSSSQRLPLYTQLHTFIYIYMKCIRQNITLTYVKINFPKLLQSFIKGNTL